MDDITTESLKYLIAQGSLGVICVYLMARNYLADRRLNTVTDKIISIAENTTQVLTEIKERI